MQLSTRGRYAVMAMVELADREAATARGRCRPIYLAEIAARQRLSLAYLEQLFARMRRAGLVRSARGPGGGYSLARAPEGLSIGEIVAAVHEPIHATRCGSAIGCIADSHGHAAKCQTHDLWAELGRQIQLFLGSITLADVLADRVAGRAARIPAAVHSAV